MCIRDRDKAMDYKAGRLVSVNVSEGSVTIKTLTEKHTSGKVNSTATKPVSYTHLEGPVGIAGHPAL